MAKFGRRAGSRAEPARGGLGGGTGVGQHGVERHLRGISQGIRRRWRRLTVAATTEAPSRPVPSGNWARPSPRERTAEAVASRFGLENHNKPAIDSIIITVVHVLRTGAWIEMS